MADKDNGDRVRGCLEARLSLLIYTTDVMKSEEVTTLLEVQPSESGNKGELSKVNQAGNRKPHPHNHWFLISDSEVKSVNLDEHLNWFLAKLEPAKEGLLKLKATPGVKIELYFIIWIDSQVRFSMTPEHFQKLAQIGLPVKFDIADYGPDSE